MIAPATITPATAALLYLRAGHVLEVLPISRRTLSNWQRARKIRFYKIGKTVLFKKSDLEAAIERFSIAAISDPKPRKANQPAQITTPTTQAPVRKRRMERIGQETPTV